MTHLLLVGAPDENQVRWFIALAGWKTPPLMRMKDFIGVISNNATTNDVSAVATCCFSYTNLNTGETQEMEDEFYDSTAQFIKSIYGIGIELQLPVNSSWIDPTTGQSHMYAATDIVLGIRVAGKSDQSTYKVVSNYFHKRLSIAGNISISSSDVTFTATPKLV